MTSHPNRSRKAPKAGANPSADEVRLTRRAIGATQKQAAQLVYSGERTWQQWEAGDRSCHPATWELFQIKAARILEIAAEAAICGHDPSDDNCDFCVGALEAALAEVLGYTRTAGVDFQGRFTS